MLIDRLVLTIAESNCYLVGCERTRQAIVVDPGDAADRILARAVELGMTARCAICWRGLLPRATNVTKLYSARL